MRKNKTIEKNYRNRKKVDSRIKIHTRTQHMKISDDVGTQKKTEVIWGNIFYWFSMNNTKNTQMEINI